MPVFLFLLLLNFAALAEEASSQVWVPRPLVGHAVFDLRVGVDVAAGHGGGAQPYLCGEISPLRRISLEGCGNGAGVLHQADVPDMAHFRLRVSAVERQKGRVEGALVGGVGFAEVQQHKDAPGFQFGEADAGQVEAAGPEVSAGFKGRYWLHPSAHIVLDATVGAAHIPGAVEVMDAPGPTVTFGAVTVGLGF